MGKPGQPAIRLALTAWSLRMNTMPAVDTELLSNVHSLQPLSGEGLRKLGRLSYPMIRKRGEIGFKRISWEEALQCASQFLKNIDPHRLAIYTTSRGLTNEVN